MSAASNPHAAQDAGALVIIGAGLAGWTTAREFRKLDTSTPIVLITADGGDFYAKPTLSNACAQKRSADLREVKQRGFNETICERRAAMSDCAAHQKLVQIALKLSRGLTPSLLDSPNTVDPMPRVPFSEILHLIKSAPITTQKVIFIF